MRAAIRDHCPKKMDKAFAPAPPTPVVAPNAMQADAFGFDQKRCRICKRQGRDANNC